MSTKKGEGQTEIPADFAKASKEARLLKYSHIADENAWRVATSWAYRHLSPSIDRYPKWLSVDEAMPEAQQEVLAFEPIMGHIVQKSWWYHADQDDKWFKRTYTHWMPLPEQPSESPATTDK